MPKRAELADWVREKRESRGFHSAAQLSREAGLAPSYVSQLERGNAIPRSDTVRRIAAVLALTHEELAEFLRLAKLAGEPASVQNVLAGLPIPGLVALSHLPGLLWRRPHTINPNLDPPDDVAIQAARSAASLLSWVRCPKFSWPPGFVDRLRNNALTAAAEAADNRELLLFAGMESADRTAIACSLLLPQLVRAEVLGKRGRAESLTRLVQHWEFRGSVGPEFSALLSFQFREASIEGCFSVRLIQTNHIVIVHDLMVTYLLWSALQLDTRFGRAAPPGYVEPEALVQAIHHVHVTSPATLRDELIVRHDDHPEVRTFRALDVGRHARAIRLVRFGVRVFELPTLAAALLKRSGIEAEPESMDKHLLTKCAELEATILDAEAEVTGRPPRPLDAW